MNNEDVETVKRLPEVQYASAVLWGREVHASHREHKGDYTLMGYTPDYQKINPQKILLRTLHQRGGHMAQKRKSCVIGTQVWKDLFPGGQDPTGKIIKLSDTHFRVVGVLRKQSTAMSFSDVERTIVVPRGRSPSRCSGAATASTCSPWRDTRRRRAKRLTRRAAKRSSPATSSRPRTKRPFWSMATAEIFEEGDGAFPRHRAADVDRGPPGQPLAGIVGVSNIMLVLVKERTQEIGIRRALGAPPRAIIGQILSESFVLTFIAGVLGLTAAVGVLTAADSIYYQVVTVAQDGFEISWMISFGTGILALAILVAGSLLAGVIPATRAPEDQGRGSPSGRSNSSGLKIKN
ncbi:MAG: ABC transporter permease [Alistipes shahii]|uniref:ABC transporter permease n=1 Tax=Alistipes shahii TaxID=328814 RepID=UPI00399D40C1